MGIQRINIFTNYMLGVEDIKNPETQELAGYVILVTDQDTGEVWRMPLEMDKARKLGQYLMGIGSVSIANGSSMAQEIDRIRKGPS